MTHPCRYTDDSSYDYSDYFEGKGYYAQTHDDGDTDISNTCDEKTAIDRHNNQQTDGVINERVQNSREKERSLDNE